MDKCVNYRLYVFVCFLYWSYGVKRKVREFTVSIFVDTAKKNGVRVHQRTNRKKGESSPKKGKEKGESSPKKWGESSPKDKRRRMRVHQRKEKKWLRIHQRNGVSVHHKKNGVRVHKGKKRNG